MDLEHLSISAHNLWNAVVEWSIDLQKIYKDLTHYQTTKFPNDKSLERSKLKQVETTF